MIWFVWSYLPRPLAIQVSHFKWLRILFSKVFPYCILIKNHTDAFRDTTEQKPGVKSSKTICELFIPDIDEIKSQNPRNSCQIWCESKFKFLNVNAGGSWNGHNASDDAPPGLTHGTGLDEIEVVSLMDPVWTWYQYCCESARKNASHFSQYIPENLTWKSKLEIPTKLTVENNFRKSPIIWF